ncbi:class I SAM-dependent methyltransferase [Streptomyces sp. G-G2]|uniref:class I SAM-dependent methyltransferase n=1 Tax=Streptomyces sp. G-G2 TaxID=3046201 RepID=UPI0024B894A8|nr:class I SAM-dependent methyltransferase [Streptomyces sp. G-G2]MDJ0385862.1 class I SAM-dependent methyltransferase [Streptomyces sp. G-G2]
MLSAWDEYARRTIRDAPLAPFSWTPYAGHGPGLELLDITAGQTVLDLGCGQGDRLAHCAKLGVRAVGVDASAVQVDAASARWGSAINVHHANAVAWLDTTAETYEAVFSVFGAHWFTNPSVLLPAVRRRLREGGVLLLAHLPPGRHPEGSAIGPTRSVLRWEGEAYQWADDLTSCGFHQPSAQTIGAPRGSALDTVLLRAWG